MIFKRYASILVQRYEGVGIDGRRRGGGGEGGGKKLHR